MSEQNRFEYNYKRVLEEYERLKDEDVPLIEDKEGKYFGVNFPFENHIAKNWTVIRNELDLKREQLTKFFEHAGDQYYGKNEDGIKVSFGSYYTYALYFGQQPYKWFQAMFPETCKLIQSCPLIYNAGFIIANGKSGLNPHYGPGADIDWPMLRGQTILSGDGNSLLSQLHDDKIYVKTQVEGESFYFDDTNMHWTQNYSDDERIVLVYDFLDPKRDKGNYSWKNHEGVNNNFVYLLANHGKNK